ncbi:MAG: IscS subfamily cysteine desulfurase [Xanthomonadaceae bacterium]|nr:IscS subfamily cysteine desulfurase [Xanthomonadaceae bacterium]
MKLPIYLDHQATTPVDSEVLKEMLPYFTEKFGNASSRHHEFGWTADSAVENARSMIAALIGAQPKEIVFTSGATESNNLAIIGGARSYRDRGRHIICTSVEHASVLSAVESLKMEGFDVTILPVDRDGLITLETLKNAIRPDTILVSVIHANNEVGSINQIQELAAYTKSKNILFHTDASQSVGKIPFSVIDLGVDLASLSSHKIYGPKGVGALYVRSKRPKIYLDPILHGGGHEQGLRAGTLNVPGIVGFGKALEIACSHLAIESARITSLRERLYQGLSRSISGVKLNGCSTQRIPGNLNIYIPGALGNALMMANPEIAFSSSSACSEADGKPSHVLREMGLTDEQAASCIRFGVGRTTTTEEIDYVIEKISKTALELRQLIFQSEVNEQEEIRP